MSEYLELYKDYVLTLDNIDQSNMYKQHLFINIILVEK